MAKNTRNSRKRDTHYALRKLFHTNYTDEDEDPDWKEADDWEDGDEDKKEEITIKISQKRRKKDIVSPKPESPKNSDLPDIPFQVTTWNKFYELTKMVCEEKKMFKDCQKLPLLQKEIENINNMIGMGSVKEGLNKMIQYELQLDQKKQVDPTYKRDHYRHMLIDGAPGLGKSSIASIVARIFNLIYSTKSDQVVTGNSRNLISGYIGQTQGYVEALVNQAIETSGVLFIDEASNLNDGGSGNDADSYGKCAVNTLMELMEEKKSELTVIFSGYQQEMERNIINLNPGMRRRIQWFFHIDQPTFSELHQIFKLKIKQEGLELQDINHFDEEWFGSNYRNFPYFGGSINNLIDKIKLVNPSFGRAVKNVIPTTILDEGYEAYVKYVLSK